MDLEDSDEEDVDEILDEEEELIVVLEQEMSLLELFWFLNLKLYGRQKPIS
jgi:hypothetical protein